MFDPNRYLPWQLANATTIFDFFNGRPTPFKDTKGAVILLRPYHAAGFVEQADAESSFMPQVKGDRGEAYGLFQFHRDRLEAACRHLNFPDGALSVQQQCAVAWWDLTNVSLGAFRHVVYAGDAYDAGSLACSLWERAGAPGQPAKRGQGALGWLSYFENRPAEPLRAA